MAEFMENLGKVLSETAEVVSKKTVEVVDVVTKKTEQTVEIQKIKNQIHVMKRNNDRDYKDIGKMIYDKFKKGETVDDEFVELCEAIAARKVEIAKSKEEIAKIKGLDVCPNCKAYVEQDIQFCPKCGANVEEIEFEE